LHQFQFLTSDHSGKTFSVLRKYRMPAAANRLTNDSLGVRVRGSVCVFSNKLKVENGNHRCFFPLSQKTSAARGLQHFYQKSPAAVMFPCQNILPGARNVAHHPPPGIFSANGNAHWPFAPNGAAV
jgi:hypothetical protein